MSMQTIEYSIIRSKRRTMALEITRDLNVVVRAPVFVAATEIDQFVQRHQQWICVHMERQRVRVASHPEPSPAETAEMKAAAHAYLPQRVAHFSRLMGLMPTGIKITSARHRFGSCSARNSLCFSYRLMTYPPEAIDYVVVHELAHILEKNHGPAFYALVERYLPDWQDRRELLKG